MANPKMIPVSSPSIVTTTQLYGSKLKIQSSDIQLHGVWTYATTAVYQLQGYSQLPLRYKTLLLDVAKQSRCKRHLTNNNQSGSEATI